MKTLLVVNAKGGSGKTTLATNAAAALAARGDPVALWDLDRQKSAQQWLAIRPATAAPVRGLSTGPRPAARPTEGWLVMDTPAGLHGKNLSHSVKLASRILVPVQPSLFDMAATAGFLAALLEEKTVRKGDAAVGIVGMRVDPRTRAASTLEAFLAQFGLPVVSWLRDTQVYPNAAFSGLGVFDLPPHAAGRDTEQWQPILEWVGP